MNELISIVIVNWNGLKWLKECLDSVFMQTYSNIEVILVDNGSSDGSVDFIKKNYLKVILIETNQNLGFAQGNNLGIMRATGNILMLLNTDTKFNSDFLTKLLNFYLTRKLDVVAPLESDYYSKENKLPYFSTIDPLGHQVYLTLENENYTKNFFLTGVCLLFSKELYIKTGGLDNDFFMYCEEIDWFWRLNLLKKKIGYENTTFIYHAGAGSSDKSLNANTFLWRNQNCLQMVLKNYSIRFLIFFIPIYIIQNILEILFFLFIGKFKIAETYIKAWYFNICKVPKIIKKREIIQKERLASDFQIFKVMYMGSGKLRNFKIYLKKFI